MLQSLVWLTIVVQCLVPQCLDRMTKKDKQPGKKGKLMRSIMHMGFYVHEHAHSHVFSIPSGPLSCFEGFTLLGYYNGSMSQTDSGFPCLKWTEFPDYMLQYPGRGLGDHSYCRNPDRESQPWCFFRQQSGAIGWAYCNCHQGEAPDPTLLQNMHLQNSLLVNPELIQILESVFHFACAWTLFGWPFQLFSLAPV